MVFDISLGLFQPVLWNGIAHSLPALFRISPEEDSIIRRDGMNQAWNFPEMSTAVIRANCQYGLVPIQKPFRATQSERFCALNIHFDEGGIARPLDAIEPP